VTWLLAMVLVAVGFVLGWILSDGLRSVWMADYEADNTAGPPPIR
jgi:hypothetical protein